MSTLTSFYSPLPFSLVANLTKVYHWLFALLTMICYILVAWGFKDCILVARERKKEGRKEGRKGGRKEGRHGRREGGREEGKKGRKNIFLVTLFAVICLSLMSFPH